MLFGSSPYLVVPLRSSCSHYKKDLAARLAGIHCTFIQPMTSILSSSTIGMLDSLAEQIRGPTNTFSTTTRYQLPSGIRYPWQWVSIVVAQRVFRRDPDTMSSDGQGFMEAYSSVGRSTGYSEEPLDLSMTVKQPPSYNGRGSWFRYEELVDDWVTFTTIEAAKRGPLLKSRLAGDAHMYKAVLHNDLLQDPDEGVNYFKNTLKKFFLKGSANVYSTYTDSSVSSIIGGRTPSSSYLHQNLRSSC